MKKLTIIAIALLLSACGRKVAKPEKAPTPVRVAAVEMLAPRSTERYSASLLPDRQVVLSFRVNGLVESIYQVRGADGRTRNVDIGDAAPQGAALARVRPKDYQFQVDQAAGQMDQARQSEQAARAQLAQSEANATKATRDFERAQALFAEKSMTRPEYDAAQAQFDATRAQVEAARHQVQVYSAAGQTARATMGTASLALHDATLVAPFPAVVVQRTVEIGSLAAPGAAAFTLADLRSVRASFGVPDVVVVNLKPGARLSLFVEALPERRFEGVITNIAAVADSVTRLFQVQVSIPNPQRILLPGMIATLALENAQKSDPQPVVPLSAIVRPKEAGTGFAVIVVEGTQARRRTVALGATYGDRVVVAGLKAGERVVSTGAPLLAEGEAVEVIR